MARLKLSHAASFWLLATVFAFFLFAAGAPSPLYVVYEAMWHFSSLTLTAIFGVYALALLAALLTTGRLSDHLGRRPVLMLALVVQIVSMVAFIAASGVGMLFAARVLQGLGTRLTTGALSAWLPLWARAVTVYHSPTGCSKWNLIEHRLFSQISLNCAGKPLRSLDIMLNSIRGTTTQTGLTVQAAVLDGTFEKGQKVSDDQMQQLNIEHQSVCRQWNYTIRPRLAVISGATQASEQQKVIF